MHSVKRILTTENRTCAIRPTAIQSFKTQPVVKDNPEYHTTWMDV